MAVILIIDDTVTDRLILKKILEKDKHKVIEAHNGEKGLRLIKKHKDIDIVLTDQEMSGMKGLDILKEVLKTSDTPPLFIMITGFSSIPLAIHFFEMGGKGFIEKPFEEILIRYKIKEVLLNKLIATEYQKLRIDLSCVFDHSVETVIDKIEEEPLTALQQKYLNEIKSRIEKIRSCLCQSPD